MVLSMAGNYEWCVFSWKAGIFNLGVFFSQTSSQSIFTAH